LYRSPTNQISPLRGRLHQHPNMTSRISTPEFGLPRLLSFKAIKKSTLSLLNRQDLLRLRLVSKSITASACTEEYLRTAFKIIYAAPRNLCPNARQSRQGLLGIGRNVRELVVHLCKRVEEDLHEALRQWGRFPPGTIFHGDDRNVWQTMQINSLALTSLTMDSSTPKLLRPPIPDVYTTEYTAGSDWPAIFQALPNLEILTIRTSRHPGGVCHTPISQALISLRCAFESSRLHNISTLRFLPVDIAYIPHFAWSGPSYGESSWWSLQQWSKISQLELQIFLPTTPFTKLHNLQIWKTFQSYLRSFSKYILVLKLHWLGPVLGPHPLRLDKELPKHHQSQATITFPLLKELWIGQVRDEGDIRSELHMLAPNLYRYMVLRTQSVYSSHYLNFEHNPPMEIWDRVGCQENPEREMEQALVLYDKKQEKAPKFSAASLKSWFGARRGLKAGSEDSSSERNLSRWSIPFNKKSADTAAGSLNRTEAVGSAASARQAGPGSS
jgi:hypothetical protein